MSEGKGCDQNEYLFPLFYLINSHQRDQKKEVIISFQISDMFNAKLKVHLESGHGLLI
jgi:hypothetical protein